MRFWVIMALCLIAGLALSAWWLVILAALCIIAYGTASVISTQRTRRVRK